jgi:hypothetical protein
MSRETFFMGDIIGYLDPMTMPGDTPMPATSVRHDRLQACAWRYIRWKSAKVAMWAQTYREDWSTSCFLPGSPSDDAQKAAITARFDQLNNGPPIVITPALRAVQRRYAGQETWAVMVVAEALRLRHDMDEQASAPR